MEDPWQPGSDCLVAAFGNDSLLVGSGQWGAGGFLAIAPRQQEKVPPDHFAGKSFDDCMRTARIDGPSIMIVFSCADEATRLGKMLLSLGESMAKDAKETTDGHPNT
jgi:hypothetical protein